MSDERWNDDLSYVFSVHRIFLRIFGLWPLQKKTVFTRMRCCFCFIGLCMILPYVLMDFAGSTHNAGVNNIESILYFVSTILGVMKLACIALYQKQLGANINAAIDDWWSAKDDKNSRKIMKKYAFTTRILTSVLLYSAAGCYCIYVSTIVLINLNRIFRTDRTSMNANSTTEWIFLIPSGPLSSLITGSQYAIIITLQCFQTSIACTAQSVVDSFYFNVTAHLAGQLQVLKHKFSTFANELDTETNHRKKFIELVNRHSELLEFNQNLEDCFHFLILAQLVTVTIMLALLGLRINICLSGNDQVEAAKSSVVMNYLLIQSFVYTYGGDFLQRESEGIFYALYTTSWFTLPLALMKDLHFAMMRSNIPFHLTGGKFFYVNRETMMYILKTAASYVSVLRIALKEE